MFAIPKGECLKVSLRFDGQRPQLAAPNTTYDQNSAATWGRFTGTIGDFSNYRHGAGQHPDVLPRGILVQV